MGDTAWKAHERWWGKFIGGERHASRGVAHHDIASDKFVGEHKSRRWRDYSAEFRHAVEQFDENRKLYPDKYPLLCFTFHGTGRSNRRFMMIEVGRNDTLEDVVRRLYDITFDGDSEGRSSLPEAEDSPQSKEMD